jgi:3-deoxy-7-phosphoheptulonate synthase
LRALKEAGQVCARMGAYKPRTSPYSFQGYGAKCLPYVFELAGKYGVRVISMEVTRAEHLDEIREALRSTGDATGVMLQIGTRNTQNFELLKTVGSQRDFPILLKRGFGITLHESLLAAEYVASEGNRDIVFCLRGMKTNFGDPHRNLVDFAHVPVVKRLTRMPVCVDPSHSVGLRASAPTGCRISSTSPRRESSPGRISCSPTFHPHPSAPWSMPGRRSRWRSCRRSSRTARSRGRRTSRDGNPRTTRTRVREFAFRRSSRSSADPGVCLSCMASPITLHG